MDDWDSLRVQAMVFTIGVKLAQHHRRFGTALTGHRPTLHRREILPRPVLGSQPGGTDPGRGQRAGKDTHRRQGRAETEPRRRKRHQGNNQNPHVRRPRPDVPHQFHPGPAPTAEVAGAAHGPRVTGNEGQATKDRTAPTQVQWEQRRSDPAHRERPLEYDPNPSETQAKHPKTNRNAGRHRRSLPGSTRIPRQ